MAQHYSNHMITIFSLRLALEHPEEGFRSRKNIRWEQDDILRSTYLAQTRITIDEQEYILYLPLAPHALERIEKFIRSNNYWSSPIIPRMEILREELCYTGPQGESLSADILLEKLPKAQPWQEAIAMAYDSAEYASQLLTALDAMERELKLVDVSLHNIRAENLLVANNRRIYPIRWYYATVGWGEDCEAITQLKQELQSKALHDVVCDNIYGYDCYGTLFENHLRVRQNCEGRIAVEEQSGWGFVDEHNNCIVKPQYRWVSDFREGRAEVVTERGMGLIDREGRYIIEPIYQALEYDVHSGHSRVLTPQGWIEMDYSGKIIKHI